MVYDPFYMVLDLFCYYFVEGIFIYIHHSYWLVIFFSVLSFSGFGIRETMACRMNLGAELFQVFSCIVGKGCSF